MPFFRYMEECDHQEVILLSEKASGLKGIIAVYSPLLGPALGGIRLKRYPDEESALIEALHLSRIMAYKTALAELPCGGGKIVLIDHDRFDRHAALKTLGLYLEKLKGRFYTARDLGTTAEDMETLKKATSCVADESNKEVGDLNVATAAGVLHGMRAALKFVTGSSSLKGITIAIQGLGGVGSALALMVTKAGGKIIASDTNPDVLKRFARKRSFKLVEPDEILSTEAQIFAPCADSGAIRGKDVSTIKAKIIAGAANVPLEEENVNLELSRKGILYIPDFLINSGAVIAGANHYFQLKKKSERDIKKIYSRTLDILEAAARENSTALEIAQKAAVGKMADRLS